MWIIRSTENSAIRDLFPDYLGGGQTVATGCAKAQRAAEGKARSALIATGCRREARAVKMVRQGSEQW